VLPLRLFVKVFVKFPWRRTFYIILTSLFCWSQRTWLHKVSEMRFDPCTSQITNYSARYFRPPEDKEQEENWHRLQWRHRQACFHYREISSRMVVPSQQNSAGNVCFYFQIALTKHCVSYHVRMLLTWRLYKCCFCNWRLHYLYYFRITTS